MRQLFFLHIPKTAGTSFIDTVKAWFPTAAPLDMAYPEGMTVQHLQYGFLWGHVTHDYFRSLPTAAMTTAVVLRDPLERLASHLQMCDRYADPDHWERKPLSLRPNVTAVFDQVRATDFEDAADLVRLGDRLLPWGQIAFKDMQVRFLTDSPRPPDFLPACVVTKKQTDRAIENLCRIDHVLLAKDLQRGIERLALAFGVPMPPRVPRSNVGETGRRVDLSRAEIRAALEPWIRYDRRLYETAVALAGDRQTEALEATA